MRFIVIIVSVLILPICSFSQVEINMSLDIIDKIPYLKIEYYNGTNDNVYFKKVTSGKYRRPLFTEDWRVIKNMREDKKALLSGLDMIKQGKFQQDAFNITIENKWIVEESSSLFSESLQIGLDVEAPLEMSYLYNLYYVKTMGENTFLTEVGSLSNSCSSLMEGVIFLRNKESHIDYFDLSALAYFGGYYVVEFPLKHLFSDNVVRIGNTLEYINPFNIESETIFLPNILFGYKLYRDEYKSNQIVLDFTNK